MDRDEKQKRDPINFFFVLLLLLSFD